MTDHDESARRRAGIRARLRAQLDQFGAAVAAGVDRLEQWANGLDRLEQWANAIAQQDTAPTENRGTGMDRIPYLTAADERRAAALLVHLLRCDYRAAAELEKESGPVSTVALGKAITSVFPESWLDPETAIGRAEDYVRLLLEAEHGLLDDDQDDECSGSTG